MPHDHLPDRRPVLTATLVGACALLVHSAAAQDSRPADDAASSSLLAQARSAAVAGTRPEDTGIPGTETSFVIEPHALRTVSMFAITPAPARIFHEHDLIEIIRYGAEHGLPEGLAWMASDDPAKFWLYPFYDVPGSVWGIDTIAYRLGDDWTTKLWMNRNGQEGLDAYWEAAYGNVQAIYEVGLLSGEQWAL